MTEPRRLRILYLANARSIHAQRWVGWFAKRHDVLLVSVPALEGETFERRDIPLAHDVPRYDVPLLSSLRIVRYLRRTIATFRPDVLHAHSLVPNAWLAVATGFPRVVTTAWGSDLLLARGLTRSLNAWALRRAALNTADADEAVRRIVEIVGPSPPTELVQFGVDTATFAPGPPSGELRRAWRLPASARLLVSPRILRPLYNGQTIARAFAQVAPSHPDLRLVMLSYNADPQYQESVQEELRRSGCSERACFAPSVSHHLMPELYRDAAMVISVPSSDTTPVTVLEAMACGCPVIASDLPALREWITPNENGSLVAAGDPAKLASAIETTLGVESGRATAIAANNRQRVVERASQDAEMGRMERLLLELVAAG